MTDDEMERRCADRRRKFRAKVIRERPGLAFRIHAAWAFLSPGLPGVDFHLSWGNSYKNTAREILDMEISVTIDGEDYLGSKELSLAPFDRLDHWEQEKVIREELQGLLRCLWNTLRESRIDRGPGGEPG